MKLKRLELAGFKSFANKTVLDFTGGITAVVGPNGSGKSNIIDAFRWILGAREAKNARSLRAEDVIFAGTQTASRMSLAQVAVTFDNADNFFPVDFAEVTIRRKISRDGEARFYLNEAEVRLKDVLDFFAKSRLGSKGFSIINQGESDLFVRSLPRERRMMLEEILGLRQFQIKKHDAELKLDSTKTNLDKAKALIEEMLPHVRLLRRQTAKFAKLDELKAELDEVAKHYFGKRLSLILSELSQFTPRFELLDRQILAAREALKVAETVLRKIESAATPRGADATNRLREQAELNEKLVALQKELGRVEAQMEFVETKSVSRLDADELADFLRDFKMNAEELLAAEDLDELHSYILQVVKDVEELLEAEGESDDGARKRNLTELHQNLAAKITELKSRLASFSAADEARTNQLETFQKTFKEAFAAFESAKDRVVNLERERREVEFARERGLLKMKDIEAEIETFGGRLDEFKAFIFDPHFDLVSGERRVVKLRMELAAAGEVDPSLVREAEEAEKRYIFLEREFNDLQKAAGDLQILIAELDLRIHSQFNDSLTAINDELQKYFHLLFGGGKARLVLTTRESSAPDAEPVDSVAVSGAPVDLGGLEVEISIPRKKIHGLEMLSGGERSLVSLAVLFALISVSPPPFIVLDEADAALDEQNSRKFGQLVKSFSAGTQFLVVTHNRATMESADVLYGVTMREDGTSRILSLKLD